LWIFVSFDALILVSYYFTIKLDDICGYAVQSIIFFNFLKVAHQLPRLMEVWSEIHSADKSFARVKLKVLLIFLIIFGRSTYGILMFRYNSIKAGRRCWSKSSLSQYQAIIEFLYRSFFRSSPYNDWIGFALIFAQIHLLFCLIVEQCFVISIAILIAWEIEVFNKSMKPCKPSGRKFLIQYQKLSRLMNEINKFLRVPLVLICVSTTYLYCMKITNYLR